MSRLTINTESDTISWSNGVLTDCTRGLVLYPLHDQVSSRYSYHYGYRFDAAITSCSGMYALIYERLGTKGLLLQNGHVVREINRTYYCADVYEFPAIFVDYNEKTYLIHCPIEYCRLDFEDVETGEIVTAVSGRKPSDIFHSHLSISRDNEFLMVCGWAWHPVDTVELFKISECFENPLLLDKSTTLPYFGTEICSASFVDNQRVLIASSEEEPWDDEHPQLFPPKHMAIWNFKTNKISDILSIGPDIGNLFAINLRFAWDTVNHPKIINLQTGEIAKTYVDIDSGEQSSSIIGNRSKSCPQICFDPGSSKLAIRLNNSTIEVLSPCDLYLEKD